MYVSASLARLVCVILVMTVVSLGSLRNSASFFSSPFSPNWEPQQQVRRWDRHRRIPSSKGIILRMSSLIWLVVWFWRWGVQCKLKAQLMILPLDVHFYAKWLAGTRFTTLKCFWMGRIIWNHCVLAAFLRRTGMDDFLLSLSCSKEENHAFPEVL